MTTRTPETVLEQVVKLLSKTVANGATADEAASAAAKAQSLMFAYNLTSADVAQRTERGVVRITESSFGLGSDSWRGEHYWQRELLRLVCKYNFTMVLDYKRTWNPKARAFVISSATVIGAKDNLLATEYVYAYLLREIQQRARKTRRDAIKRELAELTTTQQIIYKNSSSALGVPGSVVWERSFGEGAVSELEVKLRNQRLSDEANVTAEQGVLIVTLDREVEEEWYKRRYGKSKAQVIAEREETERKIQAGAAARQSAEKAAEASSSVTNAGRVRKPPKPVKPRYSRELYDSRAEEAGRAAGKDISINAPIEGEQAAEPKQLERGA